MTLRRACGQALDEVYASDPDLVVLLGSAPEDCEYPRDVTGSLRPYGVDVSCSFGSGGAAVLPLAHTIAAYLLTGRSVPTVAFGVGPAFSSSSASRELHELLASHRVALVVAGDGSARRSRTAPGYFDERAAAFDDAVSDALELGDVSGLAALDTGLGDALLAGGTRTWHAAAALLSGGFTTRLYYCDAPYGVGYFVASWLAQ